MRVSQRVGVIFVLVALFAAACGSEGSAEERASSPERPVVVATTNILGDVLTNLAGEQFDVVTIMPVGSDPHDFQPSAQDIASIDRAVAIIANGGAFEGGLLNAVEAAAEDGTPVFEAITATASLQTSSDEGHDEDHDDDENHDEEHDDDEGHDEDHDDEDHDDEDHDEEHDDDEGHDDEDHDEHDDEDHDEEHDDEGDDEDHDEEHDEGHQHGAEGIDPHFFTDPARMAAAAAGIADFLIENVDTVDTVDTAKLRVEADRYISVLLSLDEEVETMLAGVPAERRVLVTNHEVFAYFADRYDFEIIGTVVPSGSGTDGVSGRRLAELAELLTSEGVSTVFADTSSSDELARTLATEVGDVSVVELYSESLGAPESDGATYVAMVRSNARRIAEALAG